MPRASNVFIHCLSEVLIVLTPFWVQNEVNLMLPVPCAVKTPRRSRYCSEDGTKTFGGQPPQLRAKIATPHQHPV